LYDKPISKGGEMKKVVLSTVFVIMLIFGMITMGLAQEALKVTIADLEKGWQNLDIPLLEKAVKTFEEIAKKNPKDHLVPYYAAKAHFAIADCLDIKSKKEFDQTGEGEKHIDKALDLIKTSLSVKDDSVDTHILKFHVLRRKMLHVSFPGLMMYAGDRQAAYARAKELAPENLSVQLLSVLQIAEAAHPPPPPEKPTAEFEKLLKKDPKMAEAYYQIGVVWEKAKKIDEARKNYEKALEVDSHHHWSKKGLKGLASSSGT